MNLMELLYDAKREPVGLVVTTDNVEGLRQRLYSVRKEDPDLATLSFVISPINPSSELWILNKGELDAKAK